MKPNSSLTYYAVAWPKIIRGAWVPFVLLGLTVLAYSQIPLRSLRYLVGAALVLWFLMSLDKWGQLLRVGDWVTLEKTRFYGRAMFRKFSYDYAEVKTISMGGSLLFGLVYRIEMVDGSKVEVTGKIENDLEFYNKLRQLTDYR